MSVLAVTYTSPETAFAAHLDAYVNQENPDAPLAPTVTGFPDGLPALIEDLDAPHQIILQVSGNHIGLSCTCLGRARYRTLIDKRDIMPAAIAIAMWRAWHRRNGVTV
jgi:hypothetical protein